MDGQLPQASTPATLLIVDDDPLGREALEALLQSQGYTIHLAANGFEAIEKAQVCSPDLILLDVMMPGMNGFEVCQWLRATPVLCEVPIILLTALDDRASRLKGIEAGADDFITKPFDRIELRARVRTITRLNRYRHLLAERAKFARMIELAPDGVMIVDAAERVVLGNSTMLRMLGFSQEAALLGKQITAFLGVAQQATCRAQLQEIIAKPTSIARFEALLLGQDGKRLPIELNAGHFIWDGKPAVQLIARDITERKRAELFEEERRHLAYELHDGLAQFVTSTHQHIQAYAGRHRPRNAEARQRLDQVLDIARRSVQEVRHVIAGLRPTVLEDLGLAAALRLTCESLQVEGWELVYHEALGNIQLPPYIETVLFRVTTEALTNIRKHAGTTRARVQLDYHKYQIRLAVQDWGSGFEAASAAANSRPGERIGLRGMRERIELLGGRWQLISHPGIGTLIVATIPVSPNDESKIKYGS